jgi:hypothetical protein
MVLEKIFDQLDDIDDVVSASRTPTKMLGPGHTRICKCGSNIFHPTCRKILNIIVHGISG